MSARAPLWHMACKNVKYVSKKTGKIQFQIGCISFPNLETDQVIQGASCNNLCFKI